MIHNGYTCHISPFLPIDEIVKACNIKTKEEVRILTGKKINCYKVGDKLIMSQELYDTIKDKL